MFPGCLSPEYGFWTVYYLQMFFPLILTCSVVSCVLIGRLLERFSLKLLTFKPNSIIMSLYSLYSFIGVALYTSLVFNALVPLQCREASNGNSYVITNPSIQCYDQKWNKNLPMVVVFILLYFVVIPCSYAAICFRQKNQVQSAWFLQRFGDLIYGYKQEYFWWEMVWMLKKIGFVVSLHSLSIATTGSSKFFVSIVYLFGFLLVELAVLPITRTFTRTISLMYSLIFNSTSVINRVLCLGGVFCTWSS
jgi:hypothetical protein